MDIDYEHEAIDVAVYFDEATRIGYTDEFGRIADVWREYLRLAKKREWHRTSCDCENGR